MKKLQRCAALAAVFCLLAGCAGESYPTPDYTFQDHADPDEDQYVTQLADLSLLKEGQLVLITEEMSSPYRREATLTKDPNFGYDFRYCDLSELDLSGIDLWQSSFSTTTVWPDQPLLTGHEQYKDNLMLYERVHCRGEEAAMHGPAVASLAGGKDTGVAPGAKLYYIATTHGHNGDNGYQFDAGILADCIDRVVEINGQLPDGEKIRVISISRGFNEQDEGYDRMLEAIAHAEKNGIFVLTTSPQEYASFRWYGLDRDVSGEADELSAYHPAAWISEQYYAWMATQRSICCWSPPAGVPTPLLTGHGNMSGTTPAG